MSFKGFPTSGGILTKLANYSEELSKVLQKYQTLKNIGGNQHAADVVNKSYYDINAGTPVVLDATQPTDSREQRRVLLFSAAHNAREGDMVKFLSGALAGVEMPINSIPDATTLILSGILDSAPVGGVDTVTILRPVTQLSSSSGAPLTSVTQLSLIDEIDAGVLTAGVLVPTGANLIPQFANPALQIVTTTAASISKIQFIHDIGLPMALYADAARTTKICNVPLTPDEVVEVTIAAGSDLFLGALQAADIDDAGSFMTINFLG